MKPIVFIENIRDVTIKFMRPEPAFSEEKLNCSGCHAPCCRKPNGRIILSFEEAKRLPYTLDRLENHTDLPNSGESGISMVALLPRHPVTGECIFVTPDGKCSVWDLRPGACRAYSCLNDTDPAITSFARERFKIKTLPEEQCQEGK